MQFTFTEEQLDVQQRIRDCCQRAIAPGAADLDAASADEAQEMIRERSHTPSRSRGVGL